MKKEDPPPAYDLHTLKASTVELAAHEITQSKEVLREKNAVREGELNTSDWGAFLHVIKSSLGSGFLAMPDAFHNIGLLGGILGTTLVAIICAHCTHIVVKCSQELCYQKGKTHMSYTDTVETAFTVGAGGRLRHWSKFMRHLANFFMFITYYGVNTAYVVLIASSAKQVIENHVTWSMDIRWYVLLLTVVILPIGIVRHIKFLVPFSAIANVMLLVGCTLTLYLCSIDLPSPSIRPLFVEDIGRWPLFFATAIFGMEGIGTVMPIENAMRTPGHFLGCPGVLNFGMGVVAATFFVVGSIGFIRFGNDVQGSITLNLPDDGLSELVKILIALAILFSYPLQLTASMEVVWGGVSQYFSDKHQDAGYYFARILLILGTVALAAALPTLGPVISLVGAIGFSGLGLLVPSLTELVTFWKPSTLEIIKHVVLFIIYLFSTIAGSVTSVQEIIREFSDHS